MCLIYGLLWNKHFTLEAPGVGFIPLLQDHYYVLRVSFPSILAPPRVNFAHKQPWDSMVILEDANQPHPRCPQCDIFVPQEELNRAHPTSDMC